MLITNTSLDVMMIRRFFLGSYLLRLATKFIELIYVVADNSVQTNRMLVEFNVAGLLEVIVLQSTGLYDFQKVLVANAFFAIMAVFTSFYSTGDVAKSIYHIFNVAGVVSFNLLEYWSFWKD